MEELFQFGRNWRCIFLEKILDHRGKVWCWDGYLNGVCAVDGGGYSWRVAWRRYSRINVVWETHSAMFRDDGILCLHLALQRFRERIMKRDSACPNCDKILTILESGWGVCESSLYCSGDFFISLKFQSILFFKYFLNVSERAEKQIV